jgi:outer membrane receptor protein involved in Fe transport
MADQISLGFVYNLNDDWDLFVESYYQELDRQVVAEKPAPANAATTAAATATA